MRTWKSGYWLAERHRNALSLAIAVVVGAVILLLRPVLFAGLTLGDAAVLAMLAYLIAYLTVTLAAFTFAPDERIHNWAQRESRGTVWERYLLGSAPGPGVAIFIAAVTLAVAVIWLPGHAGHSLHPQARVSVAVIMVVVAWTSVLVSFAITFYADNLLEQGKALDFPGGSTSWTGYVYFALSVMTTFGTTDVNVMTDDMRRTVSVNATIAFVFNTVTVAAVVSALSG